jgi:amidase
VALLLAGLPRGELCSIPTRRRPFFLKVRESAGGKRSMLGEALSEQLNIVEASIAELRAALEAGVVTSVELVAASLNRIAYYDRHGIQLNAVPVLDPEMFRNAAESDRRRAEGKLLGPLDGIPYTAKDSYKARGLSVASGSPAFEWLVATDDAFTIARLRAAGAILIGLTNMPPMANGGMERGVYGRAESPYNADYLTSAFYSGSSNGSGTATAASFAAFGLGEETWSSGRAPASCNGLVAYTPSRGVISMRGNWPLVPTMDVVVPHARSMDDLFEILDVIVAEDHEPRGDFWRMQNWLEIPKVTAHRPQSYCGLADRAALRGRRLGIPRVYINEGAPANAWEPVITRESVIARWRVARETLERLGAEVVEVDFPALEEYERDGVAGDALARMGYVPAGFAKAELWDLAMFAWDDFLRANADPALHALADVEGALIFPHPTGAVPDPSARRNIAINLADYPRLAREKGTTPLAKIPEIGAGILGLERFRSERYDAWLDAQGLDALVFPTLADVAPADADINLTSQAIAWRNGTWVANGNLVIRHLGIPTVTVPMGLLTDIGMPIGLTFAAKPYEDTKLLAYGYAFEQAEAGRRAPGRTPPLPSDVFPAGTGASSSRRGEPCMLSLSAQAVATGDDTVQIEISGETDASELRLTVNGAPLAVQRDARRFIARTTASASTRWPLHSEWRGPYGHLIVAVATDSARLPAAAYTVVDGVG